MVGGNRNAKLSSEQEVLLINPQIEPLGRKMMAQQNLFAPVVNNRILREGFAPLTLSSRALALIHGFAAKRSFALLATALTTLLAGGDLSAASATATVGKAVTFSVSAQGTAPFIYQWYKNGAALSGGTTAAYTIASATLNDSGTYFATVRNSAGATTSDSATLTVNPVVPPVVTPPPPVTNVVSDSGFESVRIGTDVYSAYRYRPVIPNWTFVGGAGITGNNSGFTSSNSSAPEGTQVAFVQTQGSATVTTTFSAGRYVLSAMIANRANYGGSQTVLVYLDGVQIGSFSAGSTYVLATTSPFTVTSGTHDIRFAGQATVDSTLFMDQLSLAPAPASVSISGGGFEVPDAGSNTFTAFRYNPAFVAGLQDWTFQGYSGVTGNNSGFTSQNPNAPEGKQVAFLQNNNAVISQTISIPVSGNYQVTFQAAQRANYNLANQVLQVFIDGAFVGSVLPQGGTFQGYSLPFTAAAGAHQLIFKGSVAQDSTVLLDQVKIVRPGT